jgi:(4S)-4-hydroxy-5-phosphonooxypentane-2,3-dione isomerase
MSREFATPADPGYDERGGTTMIVRIITVRVKPGKDAEFEKLTRANHEGSLQEPGVLRFDVLKDNQQQGTYYLYEVYRNEEATLAHKETSHYHAWKGAVADILEGERTSVACTPVVPEAPSAWSGTHR